MEGQKALMKEAFKYRNALVSYGYFFLRDWALAEDVVQDALLTLFDKAEDRPECGVYPWMRKVVFNKVHEVLRSRRKEILVEDHELRELVARAADRHFQETPGPGKLFEAYEACMAGLDRRSTDVLIRYYSDRQSTESIAGWLKCSLNTVWLSLSRIRKRLRECVSRRLKEAEAAG